MTAAPHLHRDRGRPRGHPQHLEREPGHQRGAHRGQHRHAAQHAPLRVHADQRAPRGRRLDGGDAVEARLEPGHEGRRVGPEGAHRGDARRSARLTASGTSTPATPSTTGRPRSASASTASLLGMPASFRVDHGIEPFQDPGQAPGREPVGLGHQRVEPDGGGARLREPGHQPGQPGARPRPLAVPSQALLVDGDDDHRRRARHPRGEGLVGVESGQAQEPETGDLRHRQRGQQQEQQQDSERPAVTAAHGPRPAPLDPVRLGPAWLQRTGRVVRAPDQVALLTGRSPGRRRRRGSPPGGRRG